MVSQSNWWPLLPGKRHFVHCRREKWADWRDISGHGETEGADLDYIRAIWPAKRMFFAKDYRKREIPRLSGGEGGIRTPDTLLGCNCLAGSPVRPLQHLSAAAKTFNICAL